MDVVQSLRAIVGNDGVLDAQETATGAAGVMRFDTLEARAQDDDLALARRQCALDAAEQLWRSA
jgi:hypothetical protein